jgi:hypothetical protein
MKRRKEYYNVGIDSRIRLPKRILEHASTATKTTAAATTATTTKHLLFKDNYAIKHHNLQNAQNNGRKFTIFISNHNIILQLNMESNGKR